MSRLIDTCELSAKHARQLKEEKVRAATGKRAAPNLSDPTDLGTAVEGWRGTEPVVVMLPARIDRDEALFAARIAAVGFGCDLLTITTEGWRPTKGHERANPVTGKPWGPGEMQDVWENHDGHARGWIREGLTTTATNRAGDVALSTQDYTLTETTNALGITRWSILWEEQHTADSTMPKVHLSGYVVSQLRAAMLAVPGDVLLERLGVHAADFGITDPTAVRAHFDCGVVKSLTAAGFHGAVMLMSNDPVRTGIIHESLGKPPLDEYGLHRLSEEP